jgi:hypothetical protein
MGSSRSAVMSKSAPPAVSRLARSAHTATTVPAGNSTPRHSTSRRQIRAMNGVAGSNLSASLAARGTRPGRPASARHCRGCSAKSLIACDSCSLSGVIPPAMTLTSRFTHSSRLSVSPRSLIS